MGSGGFHRHWAGLADREWGHHPRGPWSTGDWPGRGSRPGPPPWVAELFGLAQGAAPRGPRARRGDVRAAILDMLSADSLNGYQIIQQIGERTDGAWRPSPGSVYPAISQLQDEGLVVEGEDDSGRRTLRLTSEGESYVSEHPEELAGVWEPFAAPEEPVADFTSLKPEVGAVMNAVWQIITTGTDQQRRDAVEVLIETRRKLYGLLADGEAE